MKPKKIIPHLILLLVIVVELNGQQSSTIDFFKNEGFDKAVISYYYVQDKTASVPNSLLFDKLEIQQEKKTIHKKVGEYTLTKNEISKLFKKLHKKIDATHALDTNTDIEINFYTNTIVVQHITISMSTGNLKLKKENCEKKTDQNVTIDPCLFLGKMTPEFETYIKRLLKKRNTNRDL
ncbi:hypothetical protein [Aquimarina longa]|uniref:hypothetical protein n=1 Tax=Aquimarina longa TaxID=1080221 RepID=UPI0007867CB3|nr:hypothetical protein [Aquimarina longa]